jgi:hypothetical protein
MKLRDDLARLDVERGEEVPCPLRTRIHARGVQEPARVVPASWRPIETVVESR